MATKKRRTIKGRRERISGRKKRNLANPLQGELDEPLAKSTKEGLAVAGTLAGPGKFLKVGKIFKRGDTAKKVAKAKPKKQTFKEIQAEGKARKRTGSQPRGTFGPKPGKPPKLGRGESAAPINRGNPKFKDIDFSKKGKAVVERSAKSKKANPLRATITDVGSGKVMRVGPKGLTKAQKATIKKERGSTFK